MKNISHFLQVSGIEFDIKCSHAPQRVSEDEKNIIYEGEGVKKII